MKTFCVPSHHSICADPMAREGVLLRPELLKHGIWFLAGGSGQIGDNKFEREFQILRSENEREYTAALTALMNMPDEDGKLIAVVSMRWCSFTYRLVTSKRVWLSIFRDEHLVHTFSHRDDGSPTYNFCDCWDIVQCDPTVWEKRFQDVIDVETRLVKT